MIQDEKKVERRGGARAGAGRPLTGREPKKPLPAKVSSECRSRVKSLSEQLEVSQAEVIESAIKHYMEYKSIK